MNAPFPIPVPAALLDPVVTKDFIIDAAASACARIAPLWPLKTFVAVNPFLGLSHLPLQQAAATMAKAAGARLTMDRSYYLEMIDTGRISAIDLERALAQSKSSDLGFTNADDLVAAARRSPGFKPAARQTATGLASIMAKTDYDGLLTGLVSAFCAGHFDEGQASWPAQHGAADPYSAWRLHAAIDRSPEFAGLKGFSAAISAFPAPVADAIAAAVETLGLRQKDIADYCHRLLMGVSGWAGYARYQVWQKELYGGSDGALTGLLAIRLVADAAVHRLWQNNPAYASAWRELSNGAPDQTVDEAALAIDCLLQSAFDHAWQRQLRAKFQPTTPVAVRQRPSVQAAFCIDVRSEVFRRSLEAVAGDIETLGFAGFFGFPVEYITLGDNSGGARCPVLLTPKFIVCEEVPGDAAETGRRSERTTLARKAAAAWGSFREAAVSSFAFVETLGLAYGARLVRDGFAPALFSPGAAGIGQAASNGLAPVISQGETHGQNTGFNLETQADMAEAVLRAMSLTGSLARIVLLSGHGATTANNPHANGLHCGACGGHSGEANARIAAAILNAPHIRPELAKRGLHIPADTVFVAALHDTTTDEVTIYDRDKVPPSHAADLAKLDIQLAAAGRLCRSERAGRLGCKSSANASDAVMARSLDWAEVRPEWGLAGCAAFVAAPRSRTAAVDLGGRSFLHDYDWRADEGFKILELIMTAPMVVASWISLQYYGSSVDNQAFGSGNKTLHNVTGRIGVLEGFGGDLRAGLPWQSVHDGDHLAHEPLRLAVVIEAPVDAMTDVIARHTMVRDLLDNGWLSLSALGDDGTIQSVYAGGLVWEPANPQAAGKQA